MIEKIAGVVPVSKLCAILRIEADFNFHNKLVFGQRMMDLAREHKKVLEEIYSEKGKLQKMSSSQKSWCKTFQGNVEERSWLHM